MIMPVATPEPVRVAQEAVLEAADVKVEPGTTTRAQVAHEAEADAVRQSIADVAAEAGAPARPIKTAGELDDEVASALAAHAEKTPDEPVIVGTDDTGNPVYAPAREAAEQFESEKGYLTFMKECMFGA